MPFGVTKWPKPCDPRAAHPCYGLFGYEAGSFPPYVFQLQGNSVCQDWDPVREGVSLVGDEANEQIVTYDLFPTWNSGANIKFTTIGYINQQITPNPPFTMHLILELFDVDLGSGYWEEWRIWPDAIKQIEATGMVYQGDMFGCMPATWYLTPQKYDVRQNQ